MDVHPLSKIKRWNTHNGKRVIVGISGGVDSAVAAALLLEHGFEVIGLFMKNWEEDDDDEYCSAAVDLKDAQAVCDVLDIPLETANFSHEYWDFVFAYFLEEYKAGRTPNPDVLCNKEIKFKQFLNWAMMLGADYIATGHYAQKRINENHQQLVCGSDANKDQTYFLYTLGQTELVKSLFPLGHLPKPEVRAMAEKLGLPVAQKKDSTGICFIGEKRFRDFLSQYLPAKNGPICTLDGKVIGEHMGAMYYTIGQRGGLGIGGRDSGNGEPWFVSRKNVDTNQLFVVQGHGHPSLFKSTLEAEQLHWVSGIAPILPLYCTAKTRYRQTAQACMVTAISNNYATVTFDEPQRAITPGQSIVFYEDNVCLGGGVINQ